MTMLSTVINVYKDLGVIHAALMKHSRLSSPCEDISNTNITPPLVEQGECLYYN